MKFFIIFSLVLAGAFHSLFALPSVYAAETEEASQPEKRSAELDRLRIMTRYAGMGYNLLSGNPEGERTYGGKDPGLMTTRFIVEHTFGGQNPPATFKQQSLEIPDQVEFTISDSCTTKDRANAYSGQTSYKNELSLSIEASGMW